MFVTTVMIAEATGMNGKLLPLSCNTGTDDLIFEV
jgi:hypothetical protein